MLIAFQLSYKHLLAEAVLTETGDAEPLHPTLLQAAMVNSYVVYGVRPLVMLYIRAVVV